MSNDSLVSLRFGENAFRSVDLFDLACKHKGLDFSGDRDNAQTRSFANLRLDKARLEYLSTRGIQQQGCSDCLDMIFTLIDNNPQEEFHGWSPSNCWTFDLRRPLEVRVSFLLGIDSKGGISFSPRFMGTLAGAADQLPNTRLLEALVAFGGELPAIIKEVAESGNKVLTVTWAELGFAKLLSLEDLFTMFSQGKEVIQDLARRQNIFVPAPYKGCSSSLGGTIYVVESIQPAIVQAWGEQLKKFREDITL